MKHPAATRLPEQVERVQRVPPAAVAERGPFHRILLPVDFSESSASAQKRAGELAKDSRAELVLLHVVDEPDGVNFEANVQAGGTCGESLGALVRRATHQQLDKLATEYELLGLSVQCRMTSGRPAEEILRAADAFDVDLIVMGTHSTHGLKRAMMGSVAERVVRLAHCPVLTERGTYLENLADESRP